MGDTIPKPCFPVMVSIGSRISCGFRSPPWLTWMINGSGLSKTNFFIPRAILCMVFSARGRTALIPYFSLISSAVSKMLGHGREKSICVYAPM